MLLYLSLGSNLGNRLQNIEISLSRLSKGGFILKKVSHFYETEPVGEKNQPWFLNICCEVETNFSLQEALKHCLAVERQMGRVRREKCGPRIIDIDIVLGEKRITTEALTVPHPRMHMRRFVLEPLSEIAPDFLHPVLKTSIADLLQQCKDKSRVIRKI